MKPKFTRISFFKDEEWAQNLRQEEELFNKKQQRWIDKTDFSELVTKGGVSLPKRYISEITGWLYELVFMVDMYQDYYDKYVDSIGNDKYGRDENIIIRYEKFRDTMKNGFTRWDAEGSRLIPGPESPSVIGYYLPATRWQLIRSFKNQFPEFAV